MNVSSIGIIGSGAIGMFVGSKLIDAGNNVSFIARSNFLELKHNGFIVSKNTQDEQSIHYSKINVFNDLRKMPKFDFVILCTTALDNKTYLSQLNKLLNPHTIVISLQNGINFESEIFDLIKPNLLLSGTCWIKITKLNPTHIKHDFGLKIVLSEYPQKSDQFDLKVVGVQEIIQQAGFELEFLESYLSAQITKLAINLPFFGLMIQYKINQSRVIQYHLDELLLLQDEIFNIANQLNISVDKDYVMQLNSQLKSLTETNLKNDEIARLYKEIIPNFDNFINYLKHKNIVSPRLAKIYQIISNSEI